MGSLCVDVTEKWVCVKRTEITARRLGLPRSIRDQVQIRPHPDRQIAQMAAHNLPPVIRVLVVDDHETIRRHVAAWVAKTEIAEVVAVCASASEGAMVCGQLAPDLVLCDVHMPYVDGHGFVQQLTDNGIFTPVLLFSAHAIDGESSAAVLSKTSTVPELHDAILRATAQLV